MPLFRCWILVSATVITVLAEQLTMTVFSARDGLGTTIPRIVVDSKGFIWFPCSEGLARFDGNGFRVFTQADGMPAGVPTDIVERADGTYRVAVEGHVCVFDPRPHHKRFQCESPNLGTINSLIEDEQGLWCGTDRGLWHRAHGARSWELRVLESLPTNQTTDIKRLLKDRRGDLWVASVSGLFRLRLDGTFERSTGTEKLDSHDIEGLAETAGAIWAGGGPQLLRFQVDAAGEARITGRYDRSHGLPSTYTVDVRAWHGALWAATLHGLARLLPSGRWEPVELDPNIRTMPVAALATDALGNLWLGTDGGGAARISSSGFTNFSQRDGLAREKVWAVFEDPTGDLMAVTKDEGSYFLNRFDGYRFHPVRPKIPFGTGWNWSWSQIVVPSAGEWWLATKEGLLRYRNGLYASPALIGPGAGLRHGSVFRVFKDSGGALWVSIAGVNNNGLYRRDSQTGRFAGFDESDGLPSLHVNANRAAAFAEDRSGHIWIGMMEGGLVRFRNEKFDQFSSTSGAPDQGVRALLVDRQGRLWIGSRRRGLLRVDNPSANIPTFVAYTRSSGLSDNTILALAEDLAGRVYAATSRGIDRLDPATGRIRRFTTADGLPPGEFITALRDRHGALWFGGDHGLSKLEVREESSDPPAVLVYSIRVNGQNQPISDLGEADPRILSLSSSQRHVEVNFGGFRHDLLYQTLLSGVDRSWTSPSLSRSIQYVALAPGNYELSIRAVTSDGITSARPGRVRFRIARPVWQRWWFLTFGLLGVSLAAYAAHRHRLNQAVALERVRTRIASDLHDDIGSSLSQIAILSEVARRDAGEANPQVTEPLQRIATVSREVVDSLSDIVWSINPLHDRLWDLTQRMRRFAGEVLEARDIQWELQAPGQDLDVALDADMRREVFLIFKESIHNLVRHSGCSAAGTVVAIKSGELVLTMCDNGRGFDPQKTFDGQGLSSMRARAARLGGHLEFVSNGCGGGLVLHAPLARTPLRKYVGPRRED